ncbi:MAG: hypothetical protein ACR2NM_06735 [Bythopirellula sp.]
MRPERIVRLLVAFFVAVCALLVANGANAQTIIRSASISATGPVYRLYDTNNVFREKAKVDSNTLDILSGGVIYRYRRARQYDTSTRRAYYNTTYDKVIRWPLNNSGGD